MKWGQVIIQNTLWKWKTRYISYDILKQIIKILSNTHSSQHTTTNLSKLNSKLTTIIKADLTKVDSFFNYQQEKLRKQYNTLISEWKLNKNNNKMHITHCIINGLNKLLIQLQELKNYAFINAEGFRKIIKKYDKRVCAKSAEEYYPLFNTYEFYKYNKLQNMIDKIENIINFDKNNRSETIFENKVVKIIDELINEIDGKPINMNRDLQLNNLLQLSQSEKISELFMDSVRSNNYEIILSVIKYYENNNDLISLKNIINSHGYLGNTCLMTVCAVYGSINIINLLIKYGGDIRLENTYCRNVLHIASQKGYIEIIKILLNTIQKNNEMELIYSLDKDMNNALHLCCLTKQYISAKLLINFDSKIVNQQNADGITPLMIVCGHNYSEQKNNNNNNRKDLNDILNILLKYCIKIDERDWKLQTALHYACNSGNKYCINILIKYNINPFVFNNNGKNILHIITENGYFDILKIVCEYIISINNNNNKNKIYKWSSDVSIFDHTDNKGRTALHIAASNGYKKCVNYLISIGVNTNIFDNNLCNPYSYAWYCGIWNNECPKQINKQEEKQQQFGNGNDGDELTQINFMNAKLNGNGNEKEKINNILIENGYIVKFRIQCDTTAKQYLCIIGNCKQLGNWNVTKGIKMYKNRIPTTQHSSDESETEYNMKCKSESIEEEEITWITECILPKNINIKYRYIIRNYLSLELIGSLPISEREAIITESMIIDDGVFGIHKIPRHKSYHKQLNNLTSISNSPTCPNIFNFDDTQIDFKNNYNIINDNQSKTISTNQKRYVQYGWLVSDVQLQIRLGHIINNKKREALIINNNFYIDKIIIRSGYIIMNRYRGCNIEINLPIIKENRLKIYKFQSNENQINALCSLEFEFFPRYGSSIAKVFVLPSEILSSGGIGALTLALLSPNGVLIGEFNFEYMLIKPFKHLNCGKKLLKTFKYQNKYNKSILIGHRGTGSHDSVNYNSIRRTHIKENTILAFNTAKSFGADCVEFDIQLTKDKIPIIYHDFLFQYGPFKIPINKITFNQWKEYNNNCNNNYNNKNQSRSHTPEPPLADINLFLQDNNSCSLENVFELAPINLGFNIEIKYPLYSECIKFGIENVININEYVDIILKIVFNYSNSPNRCIIFSSFHPDICINLALKQPQFPVLFLTGGGKTIREDIRCNSLKNAIKFAKLHRLFGVVTNVQPILKSPHLINIVHKYGLILLTYGKENNNTKYIDLQIKYGIDGLISDHVQYVRQHLDSHTTSQ